MGRRRTAQVPEDRPEGVGGRCDLHPEWAVIDAVPELLQDAGAPAAVRELRGTQWIADSDSRPRRHGAGLVSGWPFPVRLDRSQAPEGNRVLRPGSARPPEARAGWLLEHLLVQRLHLRLGNHPRTRRVRAAAQRLPD